MKLPCHLEETQSSSRFPSSLGLVFSSSPLPRCFMNFRCICVVAITIGVMGEQDQFFSVFWQIVLMVSVFCKKKLLCNIRKNHLSGIVRAEPQQTDAGPCSGCIKFSCRLRRKLYDKDFPIYVSFTSPYLNVLKWSYLDPIRISLINEVKRKTSKFLIVRLGILFSYGYRTLVKANERVLA